MEELFVSFMTDWSATCSVVGGQWGHICSRGFLPPPHTSTCGSLDSFWRGKEALPKCCRVFWCCCITTAFTSHQGPTAPAVKKRLQKYFITPDISKPHHWDKGYSQSFLGTKVIYLWWLWPIHHLVEIGVDKEKKKRERVMFSVAPGIPRESQRNEFHPCSLKSWDSSWLHTEILSLCSPYWNKLPLEWFPSAPHPLPKPSHKCFSLLPALLRFALCHEENQ